MNGHELNIHCIDTLEVVFIVQLFIFELPPLLKAELLNIKLKLVTFKTFQEPISLLKAEPLKVESMLITFETSQLSKGWLNTDVPLKVLAKVYTLLVFHKFNG
ncbi:hypothetical protein D3C85_1085760 [compost metagenome]